MFLIDKHSAVNLVCHFCSRSFTSRHGLAVHISRMHSAIKCKIFMKMLSFLLTFCNLTDVCDLCERSFCHKRSLIDHMNIHRDRTKRHPMSLPSRQPKFVTCEPCDIELPSTEFYEHARSTHHVKLSKNYLCKGCGTRIVMWTPRHPRTELHLSRVHFLNPQ